MNALRQCLGKVALRTHPGCAPAPEWNDNADALRAPRGIQDTEPVNSIGTAFKSARMDAPTRHGYLQQRAATAPWAVHG